MKVNPVAKISDRKSNKKSYKQNNIKRSEERKVLFKSLLERKRDNVKST